MAKPEPKEIEFINSAGTKIILSALPPYLIQMAIESVDRPTIPTYKIETEGVEEEHPYDEKSIIDPRTPAKDQQDWMQYLEDFALAESQSSEILVNVIISEGVSIPFSPEVEESWVKKMNLLKIRIPEDHEERLLMYKKQYVIRSTEDIENLTTTVMSLTLVSKKEIDAAKKSFQNPDESNPSEGEGKES
jgi:hypothetical protein